MPPHRGFARSPRAGAISRRGAWYRLLAVKLSRRSFLTGSSAGAAALLGAAPRLHAARGLLTEPKLDDLVKRALAAATKAGATYADVRVVRIRRENVATREDR